MNIGLVLSGGMAKGAFQIGALKAIDNFIPLGDIKCISCSSVGVLNGYSYAIERLDVAEKMWKDICNNDNRLFIGQMLRSTMLQQKIIDICNTEKNVVSNFYCSLLDINRRNIIYKDISSVDRESIAMYLKASVAMPIYNKAVEIGESSYFDGAMVDNIPVYPLLKKNLDYIICIYFDDICYKFENTHFDNKIIKITFPSKGFIKRSVVFDRAYIENMITTGYDTAMEILQPIFNKGYENIEHIYSYIEGMNTNESSLRITGDMLVTNLNKITQRLTKREIL